MARMNATAILTIPAIASAMWPAGHKSRLCTWSR
jgi:hypothetical protein